MTFTREEFYERLWSAPATALATELGCSDVMIGKVCKAYDIPKPYPGYWAILRAGRRPRRHPLPKNDSPQFQSLTFVRREAGEPAEPPPPPEFDPDIQQLIDRALALGPITVETALRRPHPLVAATRDWMRRGRRPSYEWSPEEKDDKRPKLEVYVSAKARTRALCIMDAIVKRVEEIGGTVEVRKERWNEHRTEPVVCFAGEAVQVLRLREKDRQVPPPAPAPEGRKSWEPKWDFEPTGLLTLDGGRTSIGRHLLRDTPKRKRIEDGLDEFVIGLVKEAGHVRIRRRQEEEERKRQAEEEALRLQREKELWRKREDLKRRQAKEKARVDRLMAEAAAWHQSRQIRAYLEAVECTLRGQGPDGQMPVIPGGPGSPNIPGAGADYLRWAREQADRLDPLSVSPPSVLDERVPPDPWPRASGL